MAPRLPALVAGIAALLVFIPAATADATPLAQLKAQHDEDHDREWSKVASGWCDDALNPRKETDQAKLQADFSDQGLLDYYKAYKITPLDFSKKNRDPIDAARDHLFTLGKNSAWEPVGDTEADKVRMWRFLVCSPAESKAEWSNLKKTVDGDASVKMREGFETDDKIIELYDEKLATMLAIVDREEDN